MEDELVKIIEILFKNICRVDSEIDLNFQESVKKFWNLKRIRDFLIFDHKRHLNFILQLNNCKEYHCIECTVPQLDFGYCNHEEQFTPYEKVYIKNLADKLGDINDERILYNTCNKCRVKFDYPDSAERDCRCQICNGCYLKSYKQRDLACQLCRIRIQDETIANIAENLEQADFEIFDTCKQCNLNYSKSILVDGLCILCNEAEKLIKQ